MSELSKAALRAKLKKMRSNYPAEHRVNNARIICETIKKLAAFKKAKQIALYHAVHGEVDLHTLWQVALEEKKTCYFPVLKEDLTLLFLPADKDTPWVKNRFGIAEPQGSEKLALSPDAFDIIFIPLLGFDEYGTRIGMGAGYYDRTLAHKNLPFLAGIAYDFQRVDYIKPDYWDIPLAATITEQAIYRSKS